MIAVTIVRSYNISARIIQFGMWVWAKLRKLPTYKTYNHCEIRYSNLTSGAIASGVKTRVWLDYVKEHKKEWISYELNLTPQEIADGIKYLYKSENTPYEFENFWYHAIKIFTGKWEGSKKATELYCYEHAIRFMNATKKYNLPISMNPYEFKIWAENNLPIKWINK